VSIDSTGTPIVEYEGSKLDFSKLRRFSVREAIIKFWQPELFSGSIKPTLDNIRDPEWLLEQ